MELKELKRIVFTRMLLFIPVMCLVFFGTAGTFRYWQAWAYITVIFVPMLFVLAWLLKKDPEFLERRMRTREKEPEQKSLVKISWAAYLAVFILPGLDRRFGWSQVPLPASVVADVLVLAGYIFVILVFRENRYASRIIEVEQGQMVISTGPYSLVRHPMYLGSIVMFAMTPLALGSYWAMIPAPLIVMALAARIVNEEKVLSEGLPGYRNYLQQVRWRLFPWVW